MACMLLASTLKRMGLRYFTAGGIWFLFVLFSVRSSTLEYDEIEAPTSYLFSVHAPSEEETTIHYISSSLIDITRDLLSITPRSREYRNTSTQERMTALQSLPANAVHDLVNARGLYIPESTQVVCETTSLYYRTMDGSCNNLRFPCWGKRDEPYRRWLPAAYDDGLSMPRRHARDGSLLPSPRQVYNLVSSQLQSGPDTAYDTVSGVSIAWGQAVAHDILFTPAVVFQAWDEEKRQFKDAKPDCCGDLNNPDCVPIKMDYVDGFYPRGHCMSIVRSQAFVYSPLSCTPLKLGLPREQMNQLTPYLDGSLVYGVSEKDARALRADGGKSALLKMEYHGRWGYLPRLNSTKVTCKTSHPTCDSRCFHAGEKRVNENPALGALHVLFAREHNRLVYYMPGGREWVPDTLFHVSRKIVGAILQHINYNEYLPLILGRGLMDAMNLTVPSRHFVYDQTVNSALFNVFVTAAYRYGHSMVNGRNVRLGGSPDSSPFLSSDFFGMDDFCQRHEDMITVLLGGQLTQKAQKVDCIFSRQLTQHLFAQNTNGQGLDLFSMNVQRGRDHGLPPYTHWREACGLHPVRDYNDLRGDMPDYVVDRLSEIYGPGHVNEVDLYVAGVSEHAVNGGILGPTFTCIVSNQFKNLKFGDRFWYENLDHPGAFTREQIESIRKTTLASLLCRTTDVREVQRRAFLVESLSNPKVPCEVILRETDLDLSLWA